MLFALVISSKSSATIIFLLLFFFLLWLGVVFHDSDKKSFLVFILFSIITVIASFLFGYVFELIFYIRGHLMYWSSFVPLTIGSILSVIGLYIRVMNYMNNLKLKW